MTSKKISGRSWTQMGNPDSPELPWQRRPQRLSHCGSVIAVAFLFSDLSIFKAAAQEMWTNSSSSSEATETKMILVLPNEALIQRICLDP